jgi:pyruvate dehydrogenase E2 component (dihydrolipoamide acetyltransferase)
VILTVESEKATFEVEAEDTGVLLQILHEEGAEAEVLSAVGYIGQPGELPPEETGESMPGVSPSPSRTIPGGPPVRSTTAKDEKIFASPSARRAAMERGIDLGVISGSGPGGRIVKADVLAVTGSGEQSKEGEIDGVQSAVSNPTPSATATPGDAQRKDRVIPFDRLHRIAAKRLTLSSREIPHFYLFQEVNMDMKLAWREAWNREKQPHLSITDLVLWAVSRVLGEFPRLNAHVEPDRLLVKARIDLGVAVAGEAGLLVPVIPDTGHKELIDLAAEIHTAVAKARKGRLDTTLEGSFTVTSLGMYGVPAFLPIINPPQCGILGIGAVQPQVIAGKDGYIGVAKMMNLVLGCDHRAVDGDYAAAFLSRLKETLETDISEEMETDESSDL